MQKAYTIEVDVRNWHLTKSFLGSKEKAYREGYDWMNMVVLQYIDANKIKDGKEIDDITESAQCKVTFEGEV